MRDFTDPLLPSELAVVCHDAGAANQLLYWLREQTTTHNFRMMVAGPAKSIRDRLFPGYLEWDTINAMLEGITCLLSGTSWTSNLEHEARKLAHSRGIRSIAILDHWVNFPVRFIRNGERILPDELWVFDDAAYEKAAQHFPQEMLRRMPGIFAQSQCRGIPLIEDLKKPEILYLLEPNLDKWGQQRAGEFQALDYFIKNLHLLEASINTPIRLRLHPSEPQNKYDAWISSHPDFPIIKDSLPTIGEALARAAWVCGCESYGMALALEAGRNVVCTLPPWAPLCPLPHREIRHLREFAANTGYASTNLI